MRAIKIISSGSAQKMSRPQKIVNDLLSGMDIPFRNEESFVYYAIDNFLPEQNLPIEVMGDYWHGSPIKYTPERLNEKQKHVISRDRAKRKFLSNQYGMPILYLWEEDVIKNPDLCVLLIKEYINSNGELENYNSFNYYMKDGVLELSSNPIASYQEEIAC